MKAAQTKKNPCQSKKNPHRKKNWKRSKADTQIFLMFCVLIDSTLKSNENALKIDS